MGKRTLGPPALKLPQCASCGHPRTEKQGPLSKKEKTRGPWYCEDCQQCEECERRSDPQIPNKDKPESMPGKETYPYGQTDPQTFSPQTLEPDTLIHPQFPKKKRQKQRQKPRQKNRDTDHPHRQAGTQTFSPPKFGAVARLLLFVAEKS